MALKNGYREALNRLGAKLGEQQRQQAYAPRLRFALKSWHVLPDTLSSCVVLVWPSGPHAALPSQWHCSIQLHG